MAGLCYVTPITGHKACTGKEEDRGSQIPQEYLVHILPPYIKFGCELYTVFWQYIPEKQKKKGIKL
jgi:hypothetical protein